VSGLRRAGLAFHSDERCEALSRPSNDQQSKEFTMAHHGKSSTNGIPAGNVPSNGVPATNAGAVHDPQIVNPTHRTTDNELSTQASRPQGPGGGVRRGDRRDTHPSFSTGKGGRGSTAGKAPDGGRSGPLGASGRKSGPKTD
jgi:hypothetical protein